MNSGYVHVTRRCDRCRCRERDSLGSVSVQTETLPAGRSCPGRPSTRYSTKQQGARERVLRTLARCIVQAHLRRQGVSLGRNCTEHERPSEAFEDPREAERD